MNEAGLPPAPLLEAYAALVLGSTGNVGRQIVNLLLASPKCRHVVLLNRRPTDAFKGNLKVREVVVPDLDTLAAAAEHAAREAGATVAFCAMGIGKGSQQMSEAEVRRVEVHYPAAFARGCQTGGVLSFGLMTATGADSRSSIRYVRIIGEKEQAVVAVGLAALGIYKPSVILGNSNTPSYVQYLYPAVQWLLPSRYRAIHRDELASAMLGGTELALAELQQAGRSATPAVRFYEYRDMQPLFGRDDRVA
jgi:uncharacterized protein YbjT (DUF2867 family)